MDATPNTFNYMVGGYITFALVMSVYIVSLVSRWKSLKREHQMLTEMKSGKE
ncbi:MAG TPA: hypothetical protein VGK00_08070 [Anaerolineales bacterium]|jgi:hypothetical protein